MGRGPSLRGAVLNLASEAQAYPNGEWQEQVLGQSESWVAETRMQGRKSGVVSASHRPFQPAHLLDGPPTSPPHSPRLCGCMAFFLHSLLPYTIVSVSCK